MEQNFTGQQEPEKLNGLKNLISQNYSSEINRAPMLASSTAENNEEEKKSDKEIDDTNHHHETTTPEADENKNSSPDKFQNESPKDGNPLTNDSGTGAESNG